MDKQRWKNGIGIAGAAIAAAVAVAIVLWVASILFLTMFWDSVVL